MLFNSYEFLVFFPAVVLIYFLLPHRARTVFLLIASYYFYMCWSPVYALLMAFSSLVTWLSGILIEHTRKKHPEKEGTGKLWVALSFIINLSILFFYKYFNFIVTDLFSGVSAVFPEWNIGTISLSVALPVGISFYTLQALGYSMDVYRGDVQVERNILRYFAFVSFFPQLVAGPIERSSNLLGQFYEKHTFDFARARDGILLMIWGYFQKLVIADRLAILVNEAFDHYQQYSGVQLLVAAVAFGFEIYCDFGGYSLIATGAAQVMGFRLMKNFDAPYLSRSVAEFWRRWHISLSTWFKDYLYFPLGGSRCSKKRRYFNLMVVFLVSGLWHGASWNFVLWGGMNGLFQVIGRELKPLREKFFKLLGVDMECFSHRILQMLTTFALIDFAWIFFCASDIRTATGLIARIFTTFDFADFFNGALFEVGLDALEFKIGALAILLLLAVDVLHYRGIQIRETLARQEAWFRWILILGGLFAVLIFGIYGPGFNASEFICFQF